MQVALHESTVHPCAVLGCSNNRTLKPTPAHFHSSLLNRGHLQLEEMYVCISYLGWETDSTSRATYQNNIHEASANISKLGVAALQ
jgi:hypothetical protein